MKEWISHDQAESILKGQGVNQEEIETKLNALRKREPFAFHVDEANWQFMDYHGMLFYASCKILSSIVQVSVKGCGMSEGELLVSMRKGHDASSAAKLSMAYAQNLVVEHLKFCDDLKDEDDNLKPKEMNDETTDFTAK